DEQTARALVSQSDQAIDTAVLLCCWAVRVPLATSAAAEAPLRPMVLLVHRRFSSWARHKRPNGFYPMLLKLFSDTDLTARIAFAPSIARRQSAHRFFRKHSLLPGTGRVRERQVVLALSIFPQESRALEAGHEEGGEETRRFVLHVDETLSCACQRP